MPIRVRCRCGQELVLRYGEWVYVFVGLTLVALVVNTLVLVLLFFRLDEPRRPASASPPTTAPDTAETPESTDRDSPTSDRRRPRSDEAGPSRLRVDPSRSQDALGADSRSEAGARSASDVPSSAESAPEPGDSSDSSRPGDWPRSLHAAADVEESLRTLLAPSGPEPSPPPAIPPEPDSEVTPVGTLALPWSQDAALWRLFLLGRCGVGRIPPEAFLWDSDPGIQEVAIEAALDPARRALGEKEGSARGKLLTFAVPALREREDTNAQRLLARLSDESVTESQDALSSAELLAFLQARADDAAADGPATSLRRFVSDGRDRGLDVVVLLDASRSMSDVLPALARDLPSFLGPVARLLPSWRLGVLLYRDDVEATFGFEQGGVEGCARTIRGARAEGGGDIPEGVHVALRTALALGHFAWSDTARKHIVIIADAPAPFAQQQPLLLLAEQAHAQGDYRVHVLSFEPSCEFGPKVPFLSELARRGGGRWVALGRPDDVPAALLRCLLPVEAHGSVDELLRDLRRWAG